jgi:hypothetical protein
MYAIQVGPQQSSNSLEVRPPSAEHCQSQRGTVRAALDLAGMPKRWTVTVKTISVDEDQWTVG